MKANSFNSPDYLRFVADLKVRIQSARLSAARSVNHDLILLYWDIGRGIVEKQEVLGWGESVIEQGSVDLQAAFPGSTGYSPRNLRSAHQLCLTYRDPAVWLQPVAKLAKQPGATGDLNVRRLPPACSQRDSRTPCFHERSNLDSPKNLPRPGLYQRNAHSGSPDRSDVRAWRQHRRSSRRIFLDHARGHSRLSRLCRFAGRGAGDTAR